MIPLLNPGCVVGEAHHPHGAGHGAWSSSKPPECAPHATTGVVGWRVPVGMCVAFAPNPRYQLPFVRGCRSLALPWDYFPLTRYQLTISKRYANISLLI